MGTQTSSPEGLVCFPSCLWDGRARPGRQDKGEDGRLVDPLTRASARSTGHVPSLPLRWVPASLFGYVIKHEGGKARLSLILNVCDLSAPFRAPGRVGQGVVASPLPQTRRKIRQSYVTCPRAAGECEFGVCVRPEGLGGLHLSLCTRVILLEGASGAGLWSGASAGHGSPPPTPSGSPQWSPGGQQLGGRDRSRCPGPVQWRGLLASGVCPRGSQNAPPGNGPPAWLRAAGAGPEGGRSRRGHGGTHTPLETFFELRDIRLRCSESEFLYSSLFSGEWSGAI